MQPTPTATSQSCPPDVAVRVWDATREPQPQPSLVCLRLSCADHGVHPPEVWMILRRWYTTDCNPPGAPPAAAGPKTAGRAPRAPAAAAALPAAPLRAPIRSSARADRPAAAHKLRRHRNTRLGTRVSAGSPAPADCAGRHVSHSPMCWCYPTPQHPVGVSMPITKQQTGRMNVGTSGVHITSRTILSLQIQYHARERHKNMS